MSSILRVNTLQNSNTSNIITQTNATTLTIGASGQTINVPTGATLTGPGAGLIWQSVQTTGFTAVKGNAYPCNTTAAAFTVTLPATPSAGDQVQVVDYAGTFDTNALTFNPNGNKIEGQTDDLRLTGEREGVILTYIDSTQGWIATSGINEGTDALSPIPSIEYLVVAGGGGGGGNVAGGGGAGGFRTASGFVVDLATNYTVTVGAGGAGGLTDAASGVSGSNSVFSTITSAGGGGGGTIAGTKTGINGGSGGGGSADSGVGGSGNTPNTSPSQGNNGGTGGGGALFEYPGSGGGGAGAVGNNGAGTTAGGGGAGTASSITGSSVTYAGGGGGGVGSGGTLGTGGVGGGGNGGKYPNNPGATAGTANTGGGGGGGDSGSSGGDGASGGSGIVILKYKDVFTITNPGGGLTSSTATAGGFSVTSFTAGTGNVQFN